MKKVQPKEGESANIVSENLERLKELFPEAFNEGGIDFNVLRQLLGDAKVLDEGKEKYGLNWHGKKKARQIALTPSTGTLLPCPEESVDWDTTRNLFIEGDNLEVLKLLQRSYSNKVKMIYIDPPYNTGKEFIYPDKFQDNLDTYLKYSGQVDSEGIKICTNTETGGRKHTNWLNMMYPRLKLAKSLLKSNGVLFISIDENESFNLRCICNDIFGEENFISDIVWEKRFTRSNNAKMFATLTERILVYRKSDFIDTLKEPRNEKANSTYTNPDSDPRGVWTSVSYVNPATKDQRPNLAYDIENPISGETVSHDTHAWKYSYETYISHRDDNRLYWGENGENKYPRLKKFLTEMNGGMVPVDLWSRQDTGTTDEGSKDLESLLGVKVFDFPKPTGLVKRAAKIVTSKDNNDLILDFFAGSGVLAQAVMELNSEDNGNRRFALVQLPEITDENSTAFSNGYKTITDIAKARIEKAGKRLKSNNIFNGDVGFKYFRLSTSNINAWNPDRSDLEETLLAHQDHLIEGRSEQDILYELLLKRGIDLTVPIESRQAAGKTIYSIGHGALFACLDESITSDQVEEIAQAVVEWYRELAPEDTHVFFRDSAFADDVAKTNMAVILEQNGITHVRSL